MQPFVMSMHWLKAGGFLQSLEKFNTIFGIKLAHTLLLVQQNKNLSPPPKITHTYLHRYIHTYLYTHIYTACMHCPDAPKAYYHWIQSGEQYALSRCTKGILPLNTVRGAVCTVQMHQRHTTIEYSQGSSLTASMMQQFKLLSNTLLASQNCQGIDVLLHHLMMGWGLISISSRAYYRHTYSKSCDLLSAELELIFEELAAHSIRVSDRAMLLRKQMVMIVKMKEHYWQSPVIKVILTSLI